MSAPPDQPAQNVWAFYAQPDHRGAKWLEQAVVGRPIFWRHGSDAHTKAMQPGDAALIYLGGDKNNPGEIVGIAVIAAVRQPFILDSDQVVQRIPAVLVEDFREKPIHLRDIQEFANNKNLKIIKNRGSVHKVDEEVLGALRKMLGSVFPDRSEYTWEIIRSVAWWDEIQDFGNRFIVLENYISRSARAEMNFKNDFRISDESLFLKVLEDSWFADPEPPIESSRQGHSKQSIPEFPDQTNDLKFSHDATSFSSSTDESADFSDESAPAASTDDYPEGTSNLEGGDGLGTEPPGTGGAGGGSSEDTNGTDRYSGTGAHTAPGMPDRVTLDAEDHLNVGKEARAFARLIASESSKPPLSVGIFGRWGSGKTFFMTQICKELNKISDSPIPIEGFHKKIVQVEFNAWHYMETNVWASLVDVIFTSLDEACGKNDKPAGSSLFDRLSTAQTLRLEAIETLAQKIELVNESRKSVLEARSEFRANGPDGKAIWTSIYDHVAGDDGEIGNADLEKAAKQLGFDNIDLDVDSLKALSDRIKASQKEGRIAIQQLRKQAINPTVAILFTVIMLAFTAMQVNPGLFPDYIGEFFPLEFSATLTGILATGSSWGAFVVLQAGKAIGMIQKVGAALARAEENAIAEQHAELVKAELSLEEANRNLEVAEGNADVAYQALLQDSPGARLASFIQERADSDDYSKHLGVIATIRKDFEQLSVLMTGEHDRDQESQKELEEFRNSMRLKIKNITKSHPDAFSNETATSDKARLNKAIRELKESLKDSVDKEKPFTRIVLKIDDLDRCPPEKVADVLQAIHLFLNFPLFTILVCVDERWMSTSLVERYKNLVDGSSGATTNDYLEKIFQIPYWTRPMNEDASRDFASALIKHIPDFDDIELVQNDVPRSGGADVHSIPSAQSGIQDESEASAPTAEEQGSEALSNEDGEPVQNEIASEGIVDNSVDEKVDFDPKDPEEDQLSEEPAREITYSPLTLLDEEREFIGEAARFSGDTPRRTLRFVNVYLLIKSSMEKDSALTEFVDPTQVTFGYKAMLVQLALATRADFITEIFFSTLLEFGRAPTPRLDAFLGAMSSRMSPSLENGDADSTKIITASDSQTTEDLIDFILSATGTLVDENDEVDRFELLGKNIANTQFMDDLLYTHLRARRYTFVAPTA